MDVLDSFREVAREHFYRLEVPNEEIQKQREKYLKEGVLKGLGDAGNKYKTDEAKKALTEAIQAKYNGNAQKSIQEKKNEISTLSNADEFANFIK